MTAEELVEMFFDEIKVLGLCAMDFRKKLVSSYGVKQTDEVKEDQEAFHRIINTYCDQIFECYKLMNKLDLIPYDEMFELYRKNYSNIWAWPTE